MPLDRKIPAAGIGHGKSIWDRLFPAASKVCVWWPSSADSVTIVGSYDTVSAANSAARAARAANGAYPHVSINWWHADFDHISIGPIAHRNAQSEMPAWYDADPAY